VLTGLLKLITLPMWILFWAIGKLFKARAVVRSGRRVYPVRVERKGPTSDLQKVAPS
jgi:hypothetical protein